MKHKITVILRFMAAFCLLGTLIFTILTAIFALIGNDEMIKYWAKTYAVLLIIAVCLWLISKITGKDIESKSERMSKGDRREW